jgi:hypothetical protein
MPTCSRMARQVGVMAIACLGLVAALIVAAAILTVQSFRRHDPLRSLIAMTIMITAALPALVYATIG